MPHSMIAIYDWIDGGDEMCFDNYKMLVTVLAISVTNIHGLFIAL